MATRKTVIRDALAVALLVLAGVLGWVGVTRAGTAVPVLSVMAILPLAAAVLLYVRRGVGVTLAVLAALLAALLVYAMNFCFLVCNQQFSADSAALLVVAVVVLALAVVHVMRGSKSR